MIWDYPHFSAKEMRCPCGCQGLPQPCFMEKLEKMRVAAGFPFIITSGFRCAEHNSRVSHTGAGGPHVHGLAADIATRGEETVEILRQALEVGMTGLGIAQPGRDGSFFVHVDCLPNSKEHSRPYIWSY
jgi:uncharacterized protein YcbK (DUF882 family)